MTGFKEERGSGISVSVIWVQKCKRGCFGAGYNEEKQPSTNFR